MRKQPDGWREAGSKARASTGQRAAVPTKAAPDTALGNQQSTTHKGGGWVMAAGWDRNKKKRKAKRGE
jgi:hypothetical protein